MWAFVSTGADCFHRNWILTQEIRGFYAGGGNESVKGFTVFKIYKETEFIMKGASMGKLGGRMELRSLQDHCNPSPSSQGAEKHLEGPGGNEE